MKILSIILLLLTGSCHGKGSDSQDKAKEVFQSNIGVVENFLSSGRSEGNALGNAISFLEQLTNIKAYSDENYSEEKIPNMYNIEDWKAWFEINNSKLVWDEKENQVKLSGSAEPLTKDPKTEYQKYIGIVEKNTSGENINLDALSYAIRFLVNITGLESEEFNLSSNSDLPTQETITKWKEWYPQNSKILYWNVKSQSLEKKQG